jgi:serine/threonine protein kinase
MEYEILGVGESGVVIRPPIECDEIIRTNAVGKIGTESEIRNEYDLISHLPVFDNAPYINSSVVSICKVDLTLIEHLPEFAEEWSEYNYQLIMPFLGITFHDYLVTNFKTDVESVSYIGEVLKGLVFVDLQRFKLIISSLYELYKKIIIMNREYNFFHRDLKPNNIMYNADENTFMLIDFGASVSKLSENPRVRDEIIHKQLRSFYYTDIIYFLDKIFLPFCYISCSNVLIFNNFKVDIIEIEKLVFQLQQASNLRSLTYGQEIDLTSSLNNFLAKLDNPLDNPLDYSLTEVFTNFPIEKIAHPPDEQRRRGKISGNEYMEVMNMKSNDVRVGGRKTKKKKKGKNNS